MDHHLPDGKTERLVALCKAVGADTYLSGPSAQDYIDPQLFSDAGIELRYANYDGYPEYRQLYPPFTHQVSILDLLLNEGPNARHYLKGNLLCV